MASLTCPTLTFMLIVLFAQNCLITRVSTKATGAPFESCMTLTPKHGSSPSQPHSTSPFVINVTKEWDETFGTEKVEVVIHSPVNKTLFRGFIVQARFANNPDILVDGEFSVNEGLLSRTYTCRPGEQIKRNNTWTHKSPKDKERVTAVWVPPEDFGEPIVFLATVVKDKNTFWENQESAQLLMGNLVGLGENESLGSTESSESGNGNGDKSGEHKHSAMENSQFSGSNFSETVKAGSGSGSGTHQVPISIVLLFSICLYACSILY